jgi:uncharacterized protein
MRLWRRPRTEACGCSPRTCATCCWPRRPAPASPWASIPASAPASRSPSSTRHRQGGRDHAIYPHEPQNKWDESLATLGKLAVAHRVDLIAIGNGTASRETDKLAAELIKLLPELKLTKKMVSEAGASVYSASAFASQELPELDVTLRGAVSIARRLQDPLAELVKIDPKAIGVGQYQHDLGEIQAGALARRRGRGLRQRGRRRRQHRVAPLLARVSGIGAGLAQNIVQHRDANGPFKSRKALKEVPRLGPKAFEQCAGLPAHPGGDDPLDASGVHPEAYPVVRRILAATKSDIKALIGNSRDRARS